MRALLIPLLTALAVLAAPAAAQGSFSPAIQVNDRVITYFELDQRETRCCGPFTTPGDLTALARTQLIETRLKDEAARRAGLRLDRRRVWKPLWPISPAAPDLELEPFPAGAGRRRGEPETFRDFRAHQCLVARFQYRARFGDRASGQRGRDSTQALGQDRGRADRGPAVRNHDPPAPPPRAGPGPGHAERNQPADLAESAFESEARRVSALPSRSRGGRLDLVLPINQLPAGPARVDLTLAPGEVTAPSSQIPIGVACSR